MPALHTLPENATKNVEGTQLSIRAVEEKSRALVAYLDALKENKTALSAEEHEQMVVKLTYQLGQAALSELFAGYDVSSDFIQFDQQTYTRKHKASKAYQTTFGTVHIERHVYANRKKDGDGKSICPLEMQAVHSENNFKQMMH
jgi:hypothetical protein